MKKTIDIRGKNAYGLLSSAVAPRPIAFASTVDKAGNVNLSPFSFFNVFSANPPILIFSPVRSARTMEDKDTLKNIKECPEVSISIVNYPMVEQMSLASTAYKKGVNEFEKAGFTEAKSELIKPPHVYESPVSFECKVNQIIETGLEGGAGHLVICEVLMAHVDESMMKEGDIMDATKLDLVARMGENWYCRADKASLFEIPKPIRNKGIGVDALPEHVRNSEILSGNNLGRLGNLDRLPSKDEIEKYRNNKDNKDEIHRRAKEALNAGKNLEALAILMSMEVRKVG